eukprot:ANDGO_04969.mRNA.1 hypothetical protein
MNQYQSYGTDASESQVATRFASGRSGWDFQPHNLPLLSDKEKIVKVSDHTSKGPKRILILGLIQLAAVIAGGAGGYTSYAIAHGCLAAVLLLIGCYVRFTGWRRKVAVLTTNRFVYRSMSAYAGIAPKWNSERAIWIRDISHVRVQSGMRNWILVVSLILLAIGFYSFTYLHNALTVSALIYGLLLMVVYCVLIFKFPIYYLRVRATRGGAWDYFFEIPYDSVDEAMSMSDIVLSTQEQHLFCRNISN